MESRDPKVRVISFLSGFTAGLVRTLIGHPFDSVKIVMQTKFLSPEKSSKNLKNLNLRTMYRGILPPMFSMGIVTSLNFTVYENCRLTFIRLLNSKPVPKRKSDLRDKLINDAIIFTSATISGSLMTILTSPFDNLRVIQQVHSKAKESGSIYWFRRLLREGNPYRGFLANLVCSGIGRGFYIYGYTGTLDICNYFEPKSSELFAYKALAAGVAGISGWVSVFPFDVIRSNMMADYGSRKFKSTWGCMKHLYATGGIAGFYTGLTFTVIRAVPVAIGALVTYDYMQSFLLHRLEGITYFDDRL